MKLEKLTTLLVVDDIEACVPAWQKLGYSIATRVPDRGRMSFVILSGSAGELMLQTRESLAEDLPLVAKQRPSFVLYADVESIASAKKALAGAIKTVLVAERETFYGATEAWLELSDGVILGLAQHGG